MRTSEVLTQEYEELQGLSTAPVTLSEKGECTESPTHVEGQHRPESTKARRAPLKGAKKCLVPLRLIKYLTRLPDTLGKEKTRFPQEEEQEQNLSDAPHSYIKTLNPDFQRC